MAEKKDKTEKLDKTFTVGSYEVKSLTRKEKFRVFSVILWSFVLAFVFMLIGFYASIFWTDIFPEFLSIETAKELLNIMITVNGLLLGFVGVVYAQILSTIIGQQNILYRSILDKGDETSDKNKSLEFLDLKRYTLSFTTFFTFGFLLVSIFSSMANIAMISQYELTDTYSTFGFLYGPVLFMMIAVILVAVSLMAVPLRPPLEPKT
jgi:hypothetical protein